MNNLEPKPKKPSRLEQDLVASLERVQGLLKIIQRHAPNNELLQHLQVKTSHQVALALVRAYDAGIIPFESVFEE